MGQRGMGLQVRRIPEWSEAVPYRDAWNALVLAGAGGAVAVPSLFQTFEWNRAWFDAFGEEGELVLLAAFEGARLVGVAPLIFLKRARPVPTRLLGLIGGSNLASDYCAFVREAGRDDVAEAFCEWIDAHPELWDELDFHNLLEDSPDFAVLKRRYGARVMKPVIDFLCDAPTRILGDPEGDREVVNKKSLKRHFNWFKNQGELTYGHAESVEQVRARLDSFFEQHIGRRSLTEAASQFIDPRQREFYRKLVDAFFPAGYLKFFNVALAGAPIAFHFGFEFAGKFYWYKPSFDIQYVKKSPGEVLLKTLFEYAIAKGLAEFDFTAGSEEFKYRFANRVRKLYRFRVFRSVPHYALHRAELVYRRVRGKLGRLKRGLRGLLSLRASGD